jgi:hypothetical protein
MKDLKIGDKWTTNNFNYYTLEKNGNIITNPGGNLSYEVIDIKKGISCYYIVSIKASFKDEVTNTYQSQTYIATYNKKNKHFYAIEPATLDDEFAIVKMKIKKNGNLRVQYIESQPGSLVYITDLQKY